MIRKILIFIILPGMFLLFSCSDDENGIQAGSDPEILATWMNESWNLSSQNQNLVEVQVYDPQGLDELESVTFELQNISGIAVFRDSLYDDGSYYHQQSGDVLAKDGIFSNRFTPSQLTTGAGLYKFVFSAKDKNGNTSIPLSREVIFDFSGNIRVTNTVLPDTLKSGITAEYLYVTAVDSTGAPSAGSVYFNIKDAENTFIISTLNMYNDGNFAAHGDVTAADSIFSFKMDSSFSASKKGVYNLEFIANDEFNEKSASVSRLIFLENMNGIIYETELPDSVKLPTGPSGKEKIQIHALAGDPQGLSDIDSVYFRMEKPDGTFSGGGAKFELKDDGSSFYGDDQAGDGLFSLIIQLEISNQKGLYKLHFNSRDKVGQLSPEIVDSLLVY